MKSVFVVMCKEAVRTLPVDWISAVFETGEKAYQYIQECEQEYEYEELKWWVEQWEVK